MRRRPGPGIRKGDVCSRGAAASGGGRRTDGGCSRPRVAACLTGAAVRGRGKAPARDAAAARAPAAPARHRPASAPALPAARTTGRQHARAGRSAGSRRRPRRGCRRSSHRCALAVLAVPAALAMGRTHATAHAPDLTLAPAAMPGTRGLRAKESTRTDACSHPELNKPTPGPTAGPKPQQATLAENRLANANDSHYSSFP